MIDRKEFEKLTHSRMIEVKKINYEFIKEILSKVDEILIQSIKECNPQSMSVKIDIDVLMGELDEEGYEYFGTFARIIDSLENYLTGELRLLFKKMSCDYAKGVGDKCYTIEFNAKDPVFNSFNSDDETRNTKSKKNKSYPSKSSSSSESDDTSSN